jgi:hypothetical protein
LPPPPTAYGDYAGWAHTILFAADLVKFRDRTNEALGTSSEASSPSKTPKGTPKKGGTPGKGGAKKSPTPQLEGKRKGGAVGDEGASPSKSAKKGLALGGDSSEERKPRGGLGSPRKKATAKVKVEEVGVAANGIVASAESEADVHVKVKEEEGS